MEKNNYLSFEEGLDTIEEKDLLESVQIIRYPSLNTIGTPIVIPMKKEYITVRYGDDNE